KSDVRERLSVESGLKRRDVFGGTAPARVHAALRAAAAALSRVQEAPPDRPDMEVTVRQARIDDLDAVCALVEYWAKQGENLPRTREAVLGGDVDLGAAQDHRRGLV